MNRLFRCRTLRTGSARRSSGSSWEIWYAEGVIAVVIVTAAGAGIGEGGGGHQGAQFGAGFELFHEQRQQFVGVSFQHQHYQRLAVAESQTVGAFAGEAGRNTQMGCEGWADTGEKHSFADIREKLPTVSSHHVRSPGERD
jgi:hypothetical protein